VLRWAVLMHGVMRELQKGPQLAGAKPFITGRRTSLDLWLKQQAESRCNHAIQQSLLVMGISLGSPSWQQLECRYLTPAAAAALGSLSRVPCMVVPAQAWMRDLFQYDQYSSRLIGSPTSQPGTWPFGRSHVTTGSR
jgi:hypothetical protein